MVLSLLALPNELLDLIIRECCTTCLPNLARTCKLFYPVATELLYQHVYYRHAMNIPDFDFNPQPTSQDEWRCPECGLTTPDQVFNNEFAPSTEPGADAPVTLIRDLPRFVEAVRQNLTRRSSIKTARVDLQSIPGDSPEEGDDPSREWQLDPKNQEAVEDLEHALGHLIRQSASFYLACRGQCGALVPRRIIMMGTILPFLLVLRSEEIIAYRMDPSSGRLLNDPTLADPPPPGVQFWHSSLGYEVEVDASDHYRLYRIDPDPRALEAGVPLNIIPRQEQGLIPFKPEHPPVLKLCFVTGPIAGLEPLLGWPSEMFAYRQWIAQPPLGLLEAQTTTGELVRILHNQWQSWQRRPNSTVPNGMGHKALGDLRALGVHDVPPASLGKFCRGRQPYGLLIPCRIDSLRGAFCDAKRGCGIHVDSEASNVDEDLIVRNFPAIPASIFSMVKYLTELLL